MKLLDIITLPVGNYTEYKTYESTHVEEGWPTCNIERTRDCVSCSWQVLYREATQLALVRTESTQRDKGRDSERERGEERLRKLTCNEAQHDTEI